MRVMLTAFAGLVLTAAGALAEDCAAPCVGFSSSREITNDWIVAARPGSLRSNTLSTSGTTEFYAVPVDHIKLVAAIVGDQVIDPEPGESSAFTGTGSFLEEAYVEWDFEPVLLRAGKFNAGFSLASAEAPGLYASDFAGVLDTDERWGGELSYRFEAIGMNHAWTGAAFTTDRTVLSESLFNNRGRLKLSDGGAGNTEGLSSFSSTLAGCSGADDPADCYADGDYGYQLGLRYQRKGHATEDQEDPQAELAFLAAGHGKLDVGGYDLHLLGETAFIRNFEGGVDDAVIVTGSAALDVEQMTYSGAYSQIFNRLDDGGSSRAHLVDLTAEYASEDDQPFAGMSWKLAAGYGFVRSAEDESIHLLGLRLTIDTGGSYGGQSTLK